MLNFKQLTDILVAAGDVVVNAAGAALCVVSVGASKLQRACSKAGAYLFNSTPGPRVTCGEDGFVHYAREEAKPHDEHTAGD